MSRIDTETLGRVHWRVAAAVTMAPQLQLNGRRKKPTMADHLIAGSSRRKLGGLAIFFFFFGIRLLVVPSDGIFRQRPLGNWICIRPEEI